LKGGIDVGVFLNEKDEHLYIVFRGTDVFNTDDLKQDLDIVFNNIPEDRLLTYQ